MKNNKTLYYNTPGNSDLIEESLPLGNGYLGAMVYGGIEEEIIHLNQESVWYGSLRDRVNPDAQKALEPVRKALFEGRLQDAESIAFTQLFATPMSQGHYEPLATLKIVYEKTIPHYSDWGKPRITNYTDYKRQLDLNTATTSVTYLLDETTYTRESFISYPDQVMVIKLTAEGKNKLDFRVQLERDDHYESIKVMDDTLILEGSSGGNNQAFAALCKVIGEDETALISRHGSYIHVSNTSTAYLLVSGSTEYYDHKPVAYCKEILHKASLKTYNQLLEAHLKDYQSLFNRVDLKLSQEEIDMATDERLKRFKDKSEDTGLLELYFHYGRYLLISCSRQGSLPANLQGIWSKDMQPPWGCKYTININTQMNYWPAETTNLSECHQPLFDHINKMAIEGRKVAKNMYNCQGIVAHHNTDIYGDCAPQDQWMPATIWPMGLAWLSTHIIEHYRFTKDTRFAKSYLSILEENLLFFKDYLIKDDMGQWVTSPSTSPENTYLLDNGEKSALCFGPTMDSQILHHLITGYLEITADLKYETPLIESVLSILKDLPKTQLGSRGQIMEWTKEYEEWEKGHRHVSHLYGLHPGDSISADKTPDLFNGAKTTLEERLEHGGGHTGWSRAWIINFYARLHQGDKALNNIEALLDHSTAMNLFDMHPPFQIDGNFGATAGIAEMLLQSHDDYIHLLPALPSKWSNGYVKGLKARGNITVSMWWEDNKIRKVLLQSPISQMISLRHGSINVTLPLERNQVLTYVC